MGGGRCVRTTKMEGRKSDYLPFNLSTIVPFEATAAALAALPSVQPRQPRQPLLLPSVEYADAPIDDETRAVMLRMLAETAHEW